MKAKKMIPEAVVLCAIIMVVSFGYAQTWRQTSFGGLYPCSIAESADGKIIVAVGSGSSIVSTNSGLTWTTNTASAYSPLDDVASSADGTKMVGVSIGGSVLVSTNFGNTWIQTSSPQGNWFACASSADGSKLVAAIYAGTIYTSTNSGATWLTSDAPSSGWNSLASSADGTKLVAVPNGGSIYTSTNSGLNWKSTGLASNPNSFSGHPVASSADGNHLVATGTGGTYISTNAGSGWSQTNITGYCVASSADGSKLILCRQDSQIYTSTNSGLDWVSTNIPGKMWLAVASSADGCELLVGIANGIWICQVTPSPQLNLAPLGNQLALSWPVPSTNFVLQQNMDLGTTNWVTLTNLPTLNFTNLHNETSLSPSNGSGFFRLATPP